ncbi:hypothetical protein [Lutibacter sp.]|uniref:hypothetical protein n=1 Tax=Lutibacter sp. TaxID=1925666 RepID=UPI00273233AB|nr:hypothetical protein [Lutibacter sp.]MDP3313367.1 hypothetical protein [Lutibacter sp.]
MNKKYPFQNNSANRFINKIIFIFILFFGVHTSVFSQTKGLIFEPATGGGAAVLDPNGDGYVSKTTAGFISNDKGFISPGVFGESEIPYVPFIFPGMEPTSDINNGPNGGFTDFVDSGTEDPAMSYLDGNNNWLFRLRMGSALNNAKSYSILIDTDGKFGYSGPNADTNATATNPGFEVEIVLATKFGVFVYNIDGPALTCSPVLTYTVTTNYQKSIAHSTIYNPYNYFLDFFVPFGDLAPTGLLGPIGITSSTAVRMAIVDNMAAQKSTICNTSSASDIAGVGGDCGSLASCFETIIDNQGPCTITQINAGLCLEKSVCPTISGSINNGATSVSGTSTEANGTTIRVYKNNNILLGSAIVSGNAWTLTGISPALASNDIIYATAQAPGESVSDSNCNTKVVNAVCSAPPTSVSHIGKSISGFSPVAGAIIKVYFNNSATPLSPTAGSLWSSGQIEVRSTATGVNGTDNFLWKCISSGEDTNPNGSGPACLATGVYRITATEPGKCESTPIYLCIGTTSSTATPTITTSPILYSTTSISGTIPSPDNISGVAIQLFVNGIQAGSANSIAGGAWTIGSLNLNSCDVVTVRAIRTGKCISPVSTGVIVSGGVSRAPTITGNYCSTGAITTVTGTSSEAVGTIIRLYSGVLPTRTLLAQTGTVQAGGVWTVTGVSIAAGNTITATATASVTPSCKTVSVESSGVLVATPASNSGLTITTDPIIEQSTSISGTGSGTDVITLFVDGFQVAGVSATVSGGVWTISGIPTYELYTTGVVTVKASSGASCQSAPSPSKIVQCISPLINKVVNPDSEIICSGSFVANIDVVNSEKLIIYQLYLADGSTPTGTSVLGNGNTITLTSGVLTANTTLRVKAFKIPVGSCEAFLTETVSVTVNAVPTLTGATQAATVCAGSSAVINLTGLLADSTSTIAYSINAVAQTPVTGVVANASGAASFTTTALTGANNGQVLQITGVTTTSTTPNCSQVFTQNVTLAVNAVPIIALSSGTQNQTVCAGTAITNTVYTFGGSATNAIVTNLPAGLTSVVI